MYHLYDFPEHILQKMPDFWSGNQKGLEYFLVRLQVKRIRIRVISVIAEPISIALILLKYLYYIACSDRILFVRSEFTWPAVWNSIIVYFNFRCRPRWIIDKHFI